MPQALAIPAINASDSTTPPNFSVKREKCRVKVAELSPEPLFFALPSIIIPAGIIINARNNANTMPIVIIQPKSITGRIPLTTKEINATAVVKTV